MIKALIFDFYGVIRTDAYKAWLKTNNIPHEGDYFDASYQQDMGNLTNEGFFQRLSELQGRPVTKEEMDAGASVDDKVVAIIKALAEYYRLALLSNSGSSSNEMRQRLKAYGIDQCFDEVILSNEVGYVKPSPEIFKLTLNQLSVAANETIFIDDNQKHVQAAEELGIKSIRFESAEQLRRDLVSLGLRLDGE